MSLILPVLIMVESALAAIVYFASGDFKHGFYWLSAAVITFSVIVL